MKHLYRPASAALAGLALALLTSGSAFAQNAGVRSEPANGMVHVPKPVDPAMARPAPAMPPQSTPVIKPHQLRRSPANGPVTPDPR